MPRARRRYGERVQRPPEPVAERLDERLLARPDGEEAAQVAHRVAFGGNRGIEPDLVGRRVAELREAKDAAEIELRGLTPAALDSGPDEDPAALLARIPNLAHALRQAPPEIKRQVFDAFDLQVTYDKPARRIEISATITEIAALQNAEDLPEEVSSVAQGT